MPVSSANDVILPSSLPNTTSQDSDYFSILISGFSHDKFNKTAL